jgi:Replication-relaxation
MSSQILSLSPRQSSVRDFVNLCGQATSSQVRRALYSGTDRGSVVRSQRHLKALTERGVIRRLPYKLSGYQRGPGEFVYCAADSKARIPNLHTLDVTELAVRLTEQPVRPVEFWPEPWCHDTWGGVSLKPDAYIKVGKRHFFAECDRGTEFASALSAQMNAYLRAYYGMDGGSFPQVLFICHSVERQKFIQREVDKKSLRALFKVCQFEEAIGVMCH